MGTSPLRVVKSVPAELQYILSSDALEFLGSLVEEFGHVRTSLLERRNLRQVDLDRGLLPDFLPETLHIRNADWRGPSMPPDLANRSVEIVGPVDRKMVINALNSGAKIFMADFEDAHSPTWHGTLQGQVNLYESVRRTISFVSAEGKHYSLRDKVATLMMRPRGWHLVEKHVHLGGEPISASLFDFGLYFFHNARELMERGTGPYFYLPKLESHLEARLWNDVFNFSQDWLKIPTGTIRATALIETILAAFEMDEIIYELREHSAGLNCGRWDYIFSFIKKLRNRAEFVLPDRGSVTMNAPFLKSYCQLLIQTCHRRGVHAMGGMSAQIPVKNDPEANQVAMKKVREDKLREVKLGHDGTWVAHPGLIEIARDAFESIMSGPHQHHVGLEIPSITQADLLRVPEGQVTEEGLRTNVRVGIQYLESWLRGVGCVPLYNLMEDAATAEISRAQVWQWIRHRNFSVEEFRCVVGDELKKVSQQAGNRFPAAVELFDSICTNPKFEDFLTSVAYEQIQ